MTHTWAIGDIHGCFLELTELLILIPDTDNIIFLGDYVDRGPNSLMVIDFVIENINNPRFQFLRGNHEQMMFDHVLKRAGGVWGWRIDETPDLQGLLPEQLEYRCRFLDEKLLWYIETDKNWFVHSGVNMENLYDKTTHSAQDSMIWFRHRYKTEDDADNKKHIIHGHTPLNNGIFWGQTRTNIDSGCVFGGQLTAARVGPHGRPDRFLQVENKTL